MANQAHFDLVTLGSGSAAFAAALRAQEFGKTSVMTEERTIGGTCANRGCLPSKNLIEAAKLFDDARNPRYPGLSPCPLALDFRALIAQKDEVILDYRKKRYESLVGGQFSVEKGHAQLMLILLKRMESDLRGTKCSLPLALALCCRLSTA